MRISDWSSDVCSSDLLREAGFDGRIEVDSAGTGDWHVGHPPDRRAIATARRHGVDIGGLRARQLGRADFAAFDWLLCADPANLRDVPALGPDSGRARSTLFMEWAGLEVPHPTPHTAGDAHLQKYDGTAAGGGQAARGGS